MQKKEKWDTNGRCTTCIGGVNRTSWFWRLHAEMALCPPCALLGPRQHASVWPAAPVSSPVDLGCPAEAATRGLSHLEALIFACLWGWYGSFTWLSWPSFDDGSSGRPGLCISSLPPPGCLLASVSSGNTRVAAMGVPRFWLLWSQQDCPNAASRVCECVCESMHNYFTVVLTLEPWWSPICSPWGQVEGGCLSFHRVMTTCPSVLVVMSEPLSNGEGLFLGWLSPWSWPAWWMPSCVLGDAAWRAGQGLGGGGSQHSELWCEIGHGGFAEGHQCFPGWWDGSRWRVVHFNQAWVRY